MDAAAYVALGLITALTIGCTYLVPSRKSRIDRKLAARPRAWINSAAGAVKVTGHVRKDGELLTAPLSGRPCVMYELAVDVPTRGLGKGPLWRRIVNERRGCPFFIEDDTGAARIDPSGPWTAAFTHLRSGSTQGAYPGDHGALSAILEAQGIEAKGRRGAWIPIRYWEGVLEPGVRVSIWGEGTREIDPLGDRDDLRSPPRRLTMRGTESRPLLIGEILRDRPEP